MNTECPYCGRVADRVGHVAQLDFNPEPPKPKPEDLSFCVQCGYFSRFDENLALRKLTKIEVEEVTHHHTLQRLIESWKRVRKPHLH